MIDMPEDEGMNPVGQVRTGLQLLIGVGLIAYGVGRFTDIITYRIPGAALLVVGVALLVFGVWTALE